MQQRREEQRLQAQPEPRLTLPVTFVFDLNFDSISIRPISIVGRGDGGTVTLGVDSAFDLDFDSISISCDFDCWAAGSVGS